MEVREEWKDGSEGRMEVRGGQGMDGSRDMRCMEMMGR